MPNDGSGLNTSLQNPYMMAHPPVLYLGYVGFAIPFAYAMSALLAGRTDERWILTTRRFTLAAWGFLGIGILLGAKWAYESVGWGGFWGWDPVENAALIPWLVGTAFLHSVIVQEKKGMLKVWNVCLISAVFALSILGTFLTRSGITSSIHSFVESDVGPWFVAFIGIIIVFSSAVILTHLPLLRSKHRIESAISREATFLFNNLLFVALAFAVLWGVLFPILSQAVRGQQFSVSSPYYDFFAMVFGIPLIFLAGVGPVVAWRKASAGSLAKAFRWPFISAAAAVALCILAGLGSSVAGVVALSLCLFVVVCIGLELARGTVARHALDPGRGWVRALTGLIGRNRRRYGGYVVHLGVVVGIVGIIGTTVYATVAEQIVKPGQTLHVHGYALTFKGLERHLGPNFSQTGAILSVRAQRRQGVPGRSLAPLLRPRGPDREQRRDPHRLAHGLRPVRDLLRHRPERRRVAEGARQPGRRPALARRPADRPRHADRDLAGPARGTAPRTPLCRGAAPERALTGGRNRPAGPARRARGPVRGRAAAAHAGRGGGVADGVAPSSCGASSCASAAMRPTSRCASSSSITTRASSTTPTTRRRTPSCAPRPWPRSRRSRRTRSGAGTA